MFAAGIRPAGVSIVTQMRVFRILRGLDIENSAEIRAGRVFQASQFTVRQSLEPAEQGLVADLAAHDRRRPQTDDFVFPLRLETLKRQTPAEAGVCRIPCRL